MKKLRMQCCAILFLAIANTAFAGEVSVSTHYLPVSPITGRRVVSNVHWIDYAPTGELLLSSGEGRTAFVLEDYDWKPIIVDFPTWSNQEIREVIENARVAPRWPPPATFISGLFPSRAGPNEYLFALGLTYGGDDYQRIQFLEDGEILVEPITEKYFEENQTFGFERPPIQTELSNGYRIELDPNEVENLMSRLRISNEHGETVFRITDGVDGIVYGGAGAGTIAVHPDGHQVAILRTRQFEAEDSELYPPRSRITELVLVTLPAEGADCTGGND